MASTSETGKPPLSAILFDLRSVIGLLFVVYGLCLTLRGLIENNPAALAKAGGVALNLWTGVVMLAVGIFFYAWAFAKPPIPPKPHELEEGGPLHMGHEWAEGHHDEIEHRHHGRGDGH